MPEPDLTATNPAYTREMALEANRRRAELPPTRPNLGERPGQPGVQPTGSSAGRNRPVTYQTPVNPEQAEATSGWKKYSADLEAGNTAESQLALQGVRDVTSGIAKEAGESAMSRGADPALFRGRAFASGERQAAQTSADLATRQFQRRENALSGQTGAATSAANSQINLMGENRMASLGEQQLQLERDAAQQRIYDDQYKRLMEMMKLSGDYGDSFGSGYAKGSAGVGGGLGRSSSGGGLSGGSSGAAFGAFAGVR